MPDAVRTPSDRNQGAHLIIPIRTSPRNRDAGGVSTIGYFRRWAGGSFRFDGWGRSVQIRAFNKPLYLLKMRDNRDGLGGR
ncbi:MAG: hypothetical protein DWH91_04120 [Planctomycetota bacterium]|nr:MAG: hypothetical protein DWH91_04120 [Planctomycetota bacterium]